MYKSQSRNIGTKVAIVLSVVILLPAAISGVSYVSAKNTANKFEQRLKGELENIEQIVAQYGQKILEASQVTEMQTDDVAKVAREAMEGRYGEGGSKAVFQVLTEQNPNLGQATYIKIQQLVEAGRDEIKVNQTRFLDTRVAYETELGSFWTGMWMRIAEYPKIDLSKFKALSTDRASDAFKAGKESGPLQLRAPAAVQ